MRIEASMMALSPDGDLLLDLRPAAEVRLRYGPWAEGLRVHRRMGRQWVAEILDPGIPIINPANEADPNLPLQRFLATIPAEVRVRAGAYLYMQTTLLQAVARSRAAAELLRRSPTLLWLALCVANERRIPLSVVDNLLHERRPMVLRKLMGMGSDAVVRFLDRVVLRAGDDKELRVIQAILPQQHVWRGLSHWPTIPVHVVAVLVRCPELRQGRLLRRIAVTPYRNIADAVAQAASVARVWRDALRLARLLQIGNGEQALRRCRDADAVQRLHDRWAARLNSRKCVVVDGTERFPPPPIPGNEAIHPIVSEEDLWVEGKLMGHCVGSYADEVRSGKRYVYRVLRPERATIELRWERSRLVVNQFKLVRNEEPSRESWLAVHAWLTGQTAAGGETGG